MNLEEKIRKKLEKLRKEVEKAENELFLLKKAEFGDSIQFQLEAAKLQFESWPKWKQMLAKRGRL